MKVLILLMSVLMATTAMASGSPDSFVIAGKLIKAGEKYEVRSNDGDTEIGSVKTVRCQSNGAGLAVVELKNGKVYEIEYAPWDVGCSIVRPTSK